MNPLAKRLLSFAGTLLLALLIVYVFLAITRPPLPTERPQVDAEAIRQAEALRDVHLAAENKPVLYHNVDYAEIENAPWKPQGEPPLLAPLVESGQLPPIEERMGPEPLVLKGLEGVGDYGGTWISYIADEQRIGTIDYSFSYANLVRYSPQGDPIVPHLATRWETNESKSEYTFHLRRGVKWSDGEEWNAQDIAYWFDHEHANKALGLHSSEIMRHQGEIGRIEALDDYTIKISFNQPHGTFLAKAASYLGKFLNGVPEHYRRQFHPELGDPQKIAALKTLYGTSSDSVAYRKLIDVLPVSIMNPDHPRLWPWIPKSSKFTSPYSFIRNPYYFAVDTQGNQLPYIDRLVLQEKTASIIGVSSTSGDVTFQSEGIDFKLYSLLMSQREKGNYRLLHWFSVDRADIVIMPNLNRRIVPEDPTTKWKHEYLNKVDFRKALSIAINRQQIIESQFYGVGEPAQVDPGKDSPFHSPELYSAYTAFDPPSANAMLDAIGLDQRDSEGFRAFPDGTRAHFFIHFNNSMDNVDTQALQLVADDWRRVGIRTSIRPLSATLWRTEVFGLQPDFSVGAGYSEFYPLLLPRMLAPGSSFSDYAFAYSQWYERGGLAAPEGAVMETGQPIPVGHPMREALIAWEKATLQTTLEKQREVFKTVTDIAKENLYTIGISTPVPRLSVVSKQLRNVPETAILSGIYSTPGNAGLETFYFDDLEPNPQIEAQLRDQLINPDYASRNSQALQSNSTSPNSVSILSTTLKTIVFLVLIAVIILLALRHPFIGRRLLVMIPTLFIISIATFTILQLPPGDFLTSKLIQLEANGTPNAMEQIEDYKKMYGLDDPKIVQYLRWSGLLWFVTFEQSDKGLLQGDLGLAMQGERPVNDIVGDRILMTFLISVGTILFTWGFALPIGIYSAVRQYSPGDYIISFLGFIGMCIPNFLFAVILMLLAKKFFGIDTSGLFSSEYVTNPDWSFGKVLDLMKHIWLPILVVAASSLAGMIRVMRSNLLDELKKPYVTTARAKGLRPTKLLLKYPVRLALNPFISSIGGIFPQLVSGAAIVAVVLSLPTTGSLMLQALLSEDLFLAGSMLMILSALGVLGTLISDLLLMVLDPRIRMERSLK